MRLSSSMLLFWLLIPTALLLMKCGSAEDSSREASWTDSSAQTRKAGFETKTDTVTLQSTSQHGDMVDPENPGKLRFMVQIGSFAESKNASSVQTRARRRYKRPVVKEYIAAKRQYQIRIGFFETEQTANEFRLRLLKEYPEEYRSAWVVRVNK